MNIFIKGAAAFIAGIGLIFVIKPLAVRINLTDKPNTPLKQHRDPIPQIGGTVMYIIILAFYIISCIRFEPIIPVDIFIALSSVYVLGLIDDYKRLSPLPKLIVQAAIAIFIILRGYIIEVTILPYIFQCIITFIWVLGIMNAFNLMDIMDGLAAGIGLIISLTLLFISITASYSMPVIPLALISGFLIAFLIFNKPKASIYLGDSGSLLLGFMLAVLSISTRYTSMNSIAYLTPILIFGIPIFDTTYVTMTRILKGKNPLHGSKDHFALNLTNIVQRKGFIVFVMVLLQMMLSLLAYISTIVSIIWAAVIYAFTLIILIRIGFYIHGLSND